MWKMTLGTWGQEMKTEGGTWGQEMKTEGFREDWSVIVRQTKFSTELTVTARVAVRRWTVARITVECITLDDV
jgi:hypothetical protein